MSQAYARCQNAVWQLVKDNPGMPLDAILKALPLLPRRELEQAIDNMAKDGQIVLFHRLRDGITRAAMPNHLPLRRRGTEGASPLQELISNRTTLRREKTAIENRISNRMKSVARYEQRGNEREAARFRQLIAEDKVLLAQIRARWKAADRLVRQAKSEGVA